MHNNSHIHRQESTVSRYITQELCEKRALLLVVVRLGSLLLPESLGLAVSSDSLGNKGSYKYTPRIAYKREQPKGTQVGQGPLEDPRRAPPSRGHHDEKPHPDAALADDQEGVEYAP